MLFDEIEVIWKIFTDTFDISKDLIDEKNYNALSCVSDERSLFSTCRYDGSNFGLKVNLKSFKKFLDEHIDNLNLIIMTFYLAVAVKNQLLRQIKLGLSLRGFEIK